VKASRGQIVAVVALVTVAAVTFYVGIGSRPGADDRPVSRAAARSAQALEDVPAIGLDRLSAAESAGTDEGVEGGAGSAATAFGSGSDLEIPPPPPQGDQPPPVGQTREAAARPMNVRFLGAVEARKGVWVAALLTDRKELLTGKEGDIVGNRYRIVKIGIESIDLVDVTSGRQRRVRLGGA